MVRVAVASANPVKLQAVREAFALVFPQQAFEVTGYAVVSAVGAQPWSDGETLYGAYDRLEEVRAQCPAADFWVAMEGGVEGVAGHIGSFGWIVVQSGSVVGRARTGMFFLPPAVAAYLEQGYELGVADDLVFGVTNSKQGLGAIGLLTGGVLTRAMLYRDAVIGALVPFCNADLY